MKKVASGKWLVAGVLIFMQSFAFAQVTEQEFSFSVETANVDSVFQKVIHAAELKGGYFTNYNNYSLSLRVPVNHLQEIQKTLSSIAKITDKSFSSTDQTSELERLVLQIESRKKLMDKYLDLVKTAPFAELQSVERELVSLNAQIESLQGRKQRIEKKAELVLITINASTLMSPEPRVSTNSPFVWINSTNLHSLREDF